VSFTVQKSLGNSFFRFAVTRRREFRSIDTNPELSTGPDGEFIRHRPEIFYSADLRSIRTPEVPPPRSISSTPITTTLTESVKQSKASLLMVGIGGLFIFIGLLVLVSKGMPGLFWLIIGLILVAIPVLRIANQRRIVRQHEERARREREERDTRNRELLATYAASLERLREKPDDETLAEVQRENEKLDLPYSIWADTAIGTVLHVGFSMLARVGAERAAEVAQLMDRASDAAGLIAEDALAVKHAVYSTILWHYLADDRLGEQQLKVVRAVEEGFGIKEGDIPNDDSAERQFERLRGIDHRNAPRCEATVPLNLNEYCLYTAPISHGEGSNHAIHITNKRVIVSGGGKPVEMAVPAIDDIVVDADKNRVTLRASTVKMPIEFGAEEPIYLAAMADLATRLDDRPKSFT
jgi:hypothetical protein